MSLLPLDNQIFPLKMTRGSKVAQGVKVFLDQSTWSSMSEINISRSSLCENSNHTQGHLYVKIVIINIWFRMGCPQEYGLSWVYLTKFPSKFIYGWWLSTKNEPESMLNIQDWLASLTCICSLLTKLTCLITAETQNSQLLYTLGEGEKSLGTKTAFSSSAGKVLISRTCQSCSVRAVNFQSPRERENNLGMEADSVLFTTTFSLLDCHCSIWGGLRMYGQTRK